MIHVELGGIPIRTFSGPPRQSYSTVGGVVTRRRSKGRAVRMQHWVREAITVSGQGWMGPGFDGLDFTQPLELRCTKPLELETPSLVGQLPTQWRPDVPPWAFAWVEGELVRTSISMVDMAYTLTAVAGATSYRIHWMPVYTVFCPKPERGMQAEDNTHDWSFTAEEV
ncbi:hypothetical protein SA496_01255 [Pseudomonas sp. JS3066]|uniref:hypothetical protein n=1 Tax=Pseudomonas sp. JS3066 TaxID=3090665 RepID=UPI002E7B6D85|nr:hypothetical protein [Pseudomonas sp. JS3066]WVK93843.1 hypothetical protein SA496_01255 [Pseudomonas sp. JS3066]